MSTGSVDARRARTLVAAARRRLGRLSLAGRFALASAVILLAGALILGGWVTQEVETSVIRRVAADSALYVEALVADEIQQLATGPLSDERRQRLERVFEQPIREGRLLSVKVWDARGEIVYATDPALIGTRPRSSGFRAALGGSVVSRRTSLGEEEQASERRLASSLIETYVPLRVASTDRVVAVAEFYQLPDLLEAELDRVRRSMWLIIGVATITMYLLLAGMVRAGSDTIVGQQRALESTVAELRSTTTRLREVSAARAETDEAVLRRVAREIHDGLAQDLAAALIALPSGSDGAIARAGIDSALREVRTLVRGMAVPDLAALPLPAVIEHACADHQRKTGRRVDLDVAELPEVGANVKIAVYRVLQEALSNALRHAPGAAVRVRARSSARGVCVECDDDGPGLPATLGEGLGVRGMRERLELLGGHLDLASRPGGGTRVVATIPVAG